MNDIEKEYLSNVFKSKINPKFDHLYEGTPDLFKLMTNEEFETWAGIKEVNMFTKLRQLLELASSDLEIYKSPDLGELLEVLNPVLSAAKKTPFTHVTIVRILEGTSNGVKYFEFWIEWTSTCWQTAEVTLLSRIVDAEDPVLEAKKVSLEENIQVSENAIKALEKSLADHQSHLVKLLKDQRELLSCS